MATMNVYILTSNWGYCSRSIAPWILNRPSLLKLRSPTGVVVTPGPSAV